MHAWSLQVHSPYLVLPTLVPYLQCYHVNIVQFYAAFVVSGGGGVFWGFGLGRDIILDCVQQRSPLASRRAAPLNLFFT